MDQDTGSKRYEQSGTTRAVDSPRVFKGLLINNPDTPGRGSSRRDFYLISASFGEIIAQGRFQKQSEMISLSAKDSFREGENSPVETLNLLVLRNIQMIYFFS
jgi:hypothetical protein